ncbi:MAG: hypothetical protein QG597_129 [Actinomycetota bacterium]|nr:hypothetical protein [Actinomycetota bacterium]
MTGGGSRGAYRPAATVAGTVWTTPTLTPLVDPHDVAGGAGIGFESSTGTKEGPTS